MKTVLLEDRAGVDLEGYWGSVNSPHPLNLKQSDIISEDLWGGCPWNLYHSGKYCEPASLKPCICPT